jgi:hypothetical protein
MNAKLCTHHSVAGHADLVIITVFVRATFILIVAVPCVARIAVIRLVCCRTGATIGRWALVSPNSVFAWTIGTDKARSLARRYRMRPNLRKGQAKSNDTYTALQQLIHAHDNIPFREDRTANDQPRSNHYDHVLDRNATSLSSKLTSEARIARRKSRKSVKTKRWTTKKRQ